MLIPGDNLPSRSLGTPPSADKDGSVVCETVEAPFSLPTEFVFRDKPECLIRAMLEQGKASLSDGHLAVEVPLSVTVLAWENAKEHLVFSSTALSEIAPRGEAVFTVYFPSAQEALWDIAKKYKISSDRLLLT